MQPSALEQNLPQVLPMYVKHSMTGKATKMVLDTSVGSLQSLFGQLEREWNVRPADMLLLNDTGHRLRPESLPAEIIGASEESDDHHGDANLYIFDQSKVELPEEERDKFYDVDKILIDQKLFGGVFEYEADTSDIPPRINPEIAKTDKEFFAHFRSCKGLYLKTNEKVQLFKNLMEKSYNQVRAMEALIRHAIICYDSAKSTKSKFIDKFKEETDRSKKVVQEVSDAMKLLSVTELHPAFQTAGRKYLKDIYYSLEKIDQFKSKCQDKEDQLHKKLNDLGNRLKDLKRQIKDVKVDRQSKNQYVKDLINNEFNDKANNIKQEAFLRVESMHQMYTKFRQSLNSLLNASTDERDELLGILIMEQDKLLQRLMHSSDDTSFFNSVNKEISKLYENLKTVRFQFMEESVPFVILMFKQLAYIYEQQRQAQDLANIDLKRLESDFNDLANVTKLQEAYESSKAEISRRRDFSQRIGQQLKILSTAVKSENRLRSTFLKKYAKILPDFFVPELKHYLPDLPYTDSPLLTPDQNLPNITGLHNPSDIALSSDNFWQAPSNPPEDTSLKEKVDSLETERKDLRMKLNATELKSNGMRIEINILKEKLESFQFLNDQQNNINMGTYFTLLDNSASQSEKRSTIGEVLKANAKQLYKFFGPLITSKNTELMEIKKELQEIKLTHDTNLQELTRNYDSRIKSYIDAIDTLNKKESSWKIQASKLKQDNDAHIKEISNLRQILNARKVEIDQKTTQLATIQKEQLEAKTQNQILKGKLESLEKRVKEDKAKVDGDNSTKEKFEKEVEAMKYEIDKLREKTDKYEADLSRLRIENNRLHEEKSKASFHLQNSTGSGKRELLDEIEKKNSELQTLNTEVKLKQSQIEELKRFNDEIGSRLKTYEKEILVLRSHSHHPLHSSSEANLHASSPSPLTSRPGSTHPNLSSHSGSERYLLIQREQELQDLRQSVEDLKHQLEEQKVKVQEYIKMLGDNEHRHNEKERKLQQKMDTKDSTIETLRQQVREAQQRVDSVQEQLDRVKEGQEEMVKMATENRDRAIEGMRGERIELINRVAAAESRIRMLEGQIAEKEAIVRNAGEEYKQVEISLRRNLETMSKDLISKDQELDNLVQQVEFLKRQGQDFNKRLEETETLEKEVEHLEKEIMKSKSNLLRYQDVSGSLFYYSVKVDTVYKGGVAIFVKYARGVYIPLVFNYMSENPHVGEVSRDVSLDFLETHIQRVKKYQEQLGQITFVLDTNSLPPRLKKLLEANSMVLVARVDEVHKEKVDLKTNKELVSFVPSGLVLKVHVGEVLCLLSASFDNSIDASQPLLPTAGFSNKTFT